MDKNQEQSFKWQRKYETLKEHCDTIENICDEFSDENELLTKEVERLTAIVEKLWIKVEDSLPEYEQHVLAYFFPRQPIMEQQTISILRRVDAKDKFRKGMLDENGFTYAAKVTHWTPLPQKPNE